MITPQPSDELRTGPSQWELVRLVKVLRGGMNLHLECIPALNYARNKHKTEICIEGASFRSEGLTMGLATQVPLKKFMDGVISDFGLEEGQQALFIFKQIDEGSSCKVTVQEDEAHELFKETIDYWHNWISKCTYTGRW